MFIDKNLFQLAKDFEFKISKSCIFKEASGTIVIIGYTSEGFRVSVNLFALSVNLRATQIRNLEAFCTQNKYKFEIKSTVFEFLISFTVRSQYKIIPKKTEELLTILKTPDSYFREPISEYNGAPVFSAEIPELEKACLKETKTLPTRFARTAALMISVLVVLFFIFQRFPTLLSYLTLPVVSGFFAAFLISFFFKGFNKNQSSLSQNLFISGGISIAATLGFIYTIALSSIPATFHRSFELINFVIIEWNSKIAIVHIALMLFLCLLALSKAWNTHKDKKLTLISIEDCEKTFIAGNKLGWLMAIFLILGGLILLSNFYFSFNYSSEEPLNYFRTALFLIHTLLSILFYFIAKTFIKDAKYLLKNEMIFLSLFAPMLITTGLSFATANMNNELSSAAPEKKFGFVSQFRDTEAWQAVCYPIIDSETKSTLPLIACERQDKFLRPGVKVSYETKEGFLKNKFYSNLQFIHPETTERLLISHQNNLEKIRSVDIKYLLQNDVEKNLIYEKYYPIWTNSCAKGEAIFCRLASYLIEEKKDDASAQLFLQKGCELKDYTSCYGLRLKDMNDPVRQKSHETLTLQACKNNDLEACKQFADLWKDNFELSHRTAYKEVLEKLCFAEDKYSCNYLIWEKYRI